MANKDITKILIPKENVNDEFATVLSLYVAPGKKVQAGQEIAELETTKSAFSIEAPINGYIYYNTREGMDLSTGSVLCYISVEPLDEFSVTKLFAQSKISKTANGAQIEDRNKAQSVGRVQFSREAENLLKKSGIDHQIFAGKGLITKKHVLSYLDSLKKKEPTSKKTGVDPAKLWKIHDVEPQDICLGLYSKEFIRRIICGGYGGEQAFRWKVIIGDICWYLHFVVFGFFWVLAKLPVVSSFYEIIARIYKRNMFGFFLRGAYYKAKLKKMGLDVIIDQGVEIWGAKNVQIGCGCHLDMNARIAAGESHQGQHGAVNVGSYVHIGPGVHLAGRGGIEIGSYTAITAGSKIFSASNIGDNPNDPTDLLPMSHAAPLDRQQIFEAPVIISDHVFVGLNVCILPGVTVGRGAIVNSGAVVTQEVKPFQIIKGVVSSASGFRVPRSKLGL